MLFLNHTYPTPPENLAIDEHLLQQVDKGHYPEGLCRAWESPNYFVVLGLSKSVDIDVHLNECRDLHIPIYKRCSGGGTVLQGPGCFNYAFILPINASPELAAITSTTSYILSMVQRILLPVIGPTQQQGISDLTINNVKFSGNAQRRLKNALLFHGTILYDFDISMVTQTLTNPPIQPDYRRHRSHQSFIQNIPIASQQLAPLFSSVTTHPLSPLDVPIPPHLLDKYQPI